MQPQNKSIIKVHSPVITPQFTNIGFGNPRYNEIIVYPDDSVLIPCGTTLRKVDLRKNQILFNKQIGCSQIFQVLDSPTKWVMVVNFQGLISLIDRDTLEVYKQFRATGKQIRHSSISKDFIAVSCELNNDTKEASLEVYSIVDIKQTEGVNIQVKPKYKQMGYYYYPEIVKNELIFIEFDDPNPKGRSRTETVLNKKLPVKHRVLRKSLQNLQQEIKQVAKISLEGEILCATQNTTSQQIFYLHEAKKITVLTLQTMKCESIGIVASAAPHCIQAHKNGIIFASSTNQLTYLQFLQSFNIEILKLNTKNLTSSYAMKSCRLHPHNFIFFNENGLQYYESDSQKQYCQTYFDITNCGISLNQDGSKFAVADFGGNIYTFSTESTNIIPVALSRTFIGIPVRTLVWCYDTNHIIIGCVGGFLYRWDGISQEPELITQTNDHTVNIVRYFDGLVIFGTSDGFVHIMSSQTMQEVYKFQSHTPIHYESEKDKELFGSMKNYAEIWSIIAFKTADKKTFQLVTCSEDQTEKVYAITITENRQFSHKQIHHLVGHSLAVTSIDWKTMGKGLGPIYVSCSDDKIVRFRNPENMFEILHELETSTIKQWHTLTYLCLEPNGHRVAIGSQNGYLFIFDILTKQLLFGEKIHLGGVEGMDWVNGKLITCSSDLCISIARL